MYRQIILFSISFIATVQLQAQSFDFSSFPPIPADYTHLELHLNVHDDLAIEGEALYTLQSRVEQLDSLLLDAPGIDVLLVELGDTTPEFNMDGNRLVIYPEAPVPMDEDMTLRISYEANPVFGLHTDEYGTIWTSKLPRSVRHWLPSFDHPRNMLTTDVHLEYPSGKTAVISGQMTDSGIVNVDRQFARYVSETPIPLSALAFAVGDFEQVETTVNTHNIRFHFRSGLLDSTTRQGLLQEAEDAFRMAENRSGTGYFMQDLDIVVLDDGRWETKQYGAGLIFAYNNSSSLHNQIIRGIAAQWFGVHIREEQWTDSNAILLLQQWLAQNSLVITDEDADSTAALDLDRGLYGLFSVPQQDRWTRYLRSAESRTIVSVLNQAVSPILNSGQGVINWYDFANFLYNETGRPFFSPLQPESDPVLEADSERHDYTIAFDFDEEASTIRLTFNAVGEPVDQLVSVTVEEITFQDSFEHTLSFTGESDEIVLDVNRTIENLKFQPDPDMAVRLFPEKPFMFWVYQLRNDPDPEKRMDAAIGLRQFADNPDLQLALLDLISSEQDPGVTAEVIRTLSAVTRGAAGTAQLFIQRFRPNASLEVQMAIVEAFSYYNNNDQVISQLQQIITQTGQAALRRKAVETLVTITNAERFRALVESLVPRQEVMPVVPALLMALAEKGEEESAVRMANSLLNSGYPWYLRSGGLDILLTYDRSVENWSNRLPDLLADRDPRIRFMAVDGLQFVSSSERGEIIENRIDDEFDQRVHERLTN